MSSVPVAPAGVTVVVCDGRRCHAVRGRTDTGVAEGESASLLGALREQVRRSQYGVLIRSGCLGVCAQAPAVLLVHRTNAADADADADAGAGAGAGAGAVFGPVEGPEQVRELLDAVRAGSGDRRAG